jgi:hypothetical protein
MRRVAIIAVTLVCIHLLVFPSVAHASYNTPLVDHMGAVQASPPWDTDVTPEDWSVLWEPFAGQLSLNLGLNTLRPDIPSAIQSEAFKTNWITETFSLPLSNHDLSETPGYLSTTDWATRWVDQKVSGMQRQYEDNLAGQYTETLLTRDFATMAGYQLQLASLMIAPSWPGAAAFISDITSDFGTHDMGQIASTAGDCLGAHAIAFGDPFSKFTTAVSSFLDNLTLRDVNQPLHSSGTLPLDFNDGFTSIHGWSELNISFTPPEIDYHPFSYSSPWEGTWTRQIQSHYTVSTGLNSNLNYPTTNWPTYGGISGNSMFP